MTTDKPGLLGMLEGMKARGRILDYAIAPDLERQVVTVTIRPCRYEAFIGLDLGFDLQPTAAPVAKE